MTSVTYGTRNRHTARHHHRESPALGSARQNRYTNPLHTTSADRRHWFASNLADSGATVDEIAELLGHSRLSSSDRYLHPADQRLREAVDRVAAPASLLAGTR